MALATLLCLAAAIAASGLGYFVFGSYTKHWDLADITTDLDVIVTNLEKHTDLKAKQAAQFRAQAARATSSAQDATDSGVKAAKIASNVRALLS